MCVCQADGHPWITPITGAGNLSDLPQSLRFGSSYRQVVDPDALEAWGQEHWRRHAEDSD